MKLYVARDGEILGEWTQTELRQLLRASDLRPSDYYWHEGMTDWQRLAELPCGKSVIATDAQRALLDSRGICWDEFTTKYDVSALLDSRPCTPKQRAFLDDLGITHWPSITTKEASELIEAELAREGPDGPCTSKQWAILTELARSARFRIDIPPHSSRRTVATEINAVRTVAGLSR